MASKVEIINMALRRLKVQTIESAAERSEPAYVMSDVYDIALKSEIERWPYTWAQRTAELAQVSGETPPDYGYAFQLPAGYVKIVSIVGDSAGTCLYDYFDPTFYVYNQQASEWEIREGKLYTNYSSITIKYTVVENDTTKWDGLFTDAFSWRLAKDAGISLTDRPELIEIANREYYTTIQMARQANGTEARKSLDLSKNFIKSRR